MFAIANENPDSAVLLPMRLANMDGRKKILDSARMEKTVRHRERKWTIERFERKRNRVRTGQFSREGAAAASFRIAKTR